MKFHRDGERALAVFIDFENLALGFGNRRDRFDIGKVLERLVEKGKIVAKKAYADWSRFGFYTGALHEAAVELVEIPKRTQTGKNSADIRMCVDAMDLAYSKDHIGTFVVVSGDSDFSPLVSKLKELGKHVIGLGLADSTSELLRDNCDEFIYYEDLDRAPLVPIADNAAIPEPKRKAFMLLLDSLLALRRENKELIFSSMAKDTMKRKKPSFNEEYHGYRTFSELLEDAQRYGLIDLEKHHTSGTYVITRFGAEPRGRVIQVPPAKPIALPAPVRPAPVRPALPPMNPQRREEPRREEGRREEPRREEPRREEPRREEPRREEPPRRREPFPIPHIPEPEPFPPLGRALIDDLDEDLADEVPSYRSRKPAPRPVEPKPAETPRAAKRATETPATPARSRPKPVPPANPEPPVEGRRKSPPREEAPRREPPATRRKAPEPPRQEPPQEAPRREPPASRRKAPEPPRQEPPPVSRRPARENDDDFGAGLDL